MKIIFAILGALLFCHLTTASSIGSLEGYVTVDRKEFGSLDYIIQSGTTAALDLAAAENVIDVTAASRLQVESVGRVSRNVRAAEEVTSYFVIVRVVDSVYSDIKAIVGFVIDESNTTGALTLRAYKIGSA